MGAWILIASISLGACGDDATPGRDAGDGTDAGGDTDGGGRDGGSDGGVAATRFGLITPFSISYDFPEEMRHHHSLTVRFDQSDGCTVTPVGDQCNTQTCTMPTTMPTYPHAGLVRVTGGALDLMVEPGADGTYPFLRSDTQSLFEGGEVLHVTAAGDEVPALDVEITAPHNVAVTAPTLVETAEPFTIARSSPLMLTWTRASGETSGRVRVMVYTPGDTGLTASANCTFPSGATSGAIPAAALMALPAGTGTIVVFVESEHEVVRSAEWETLVYAFAYALGPSGAARQNIMLD
jgi:hypothetical protein